MAKKVVATLKKGDIKGYTKVIKMIKNEKTGSYGFREEIIPNEKVKDFFSNKN